jgi:hypothetical protein
VRHLRHVRRLLPRKACVIARSRARKTSRPDFRPLSYLCICRTPSVYLHSVSTCFRLGVTPRRRRVLVLVMSIRRWSERARWDGRLRAVRYGQRRKRRCRVASSMARRTHGMWHGAACSTRRVPRQHGRMRYATGTAGVQRVARGVCRATCNVQHTACNMQRTTYGMQHAARAECTQHTTCNTRSAASQRELTRTFGGRRREPRRVLERRDAERRRASHKPLLACQGTRGGPAARGDPLCTPPQPRLHFSPARRRLRASPGADVAPLVAAAPAMTGRSPGADVAMRRWRLGIRSCPGARPPHAARPCPWRTPEAQRLV